MRKSYNSHYPARVALSTVWKSLIGLELTILVLAIAVLGLCGHILAASSSSSTVTINTAATASKYASYLFPADLNTGPTWALTATGIGGTVDALLVLLILTFGRPPATIVERKRLLIPLFIILFVSVVRSVTAVSYGWSQDHSRTLDLAEWTHQSRNAADWKGFTPYGWSKQAQEYVVEAWAISRLAQICREVQATWALSLIIALFDIIALITGIYLWSSARTALSRKL